MKQIKYILSLIIITCILIGCDTQTSKNPSVSTGNTNTEIATPTPVPIPVPTPTQTPKTDNLQKYLVKRVVDGDTFIITDNDEDIRVRLIGIDTPESVAPESYLEKTGKENTEEGKTASEFTKNLIEGNYVYLEFDAQKEDKYGRLLAYAYLEDGQMIQDILLENRYAQPMTIQPNSKYANHFIEVYRKSNPYE